MEDPLFNSNQVYNFPRILTLINYYSHCEIYTTTSAKISRKTNEHFGRMKTNENIVCSLSGREFPQILASFSNLVSNQILKGPILISYTKK